MKKFFFQPDHAWVGDLIPYYEDGTYYAYYLHDPRCYPDQYAEQTTWHLVTTQDFKTLCDAGETFPCAADDRPNCNAYTGSVIRDKDGIYHAYFTAFNSKINLLDGKPIQAVMRAKGTDPAHLTVDEDFFFTADDRIYEMYDWRDPCVTYNEAEDCYYMLLCARKKGAGALRGGCLALCKSKDLNSWTYEAPFYDPHMYVTMECPDLFRMGDWYYLAFSTFSDRFATHYRMAKDPCGPWKIPELDTFDSRDNYAIKTGGDDRKRYLFGWIPSKKGNTDYGPWEWGGTMVFHELVQDPETGLLTVKTTGAEESFFSSGRELTGQKEFFAEAAAQEDGLALSAENLGAVLYDAPEESFLLDAELEIREGTEFGLALHTDGGLEKGYFLRMWPGKQMAWDIWPRTDRPGIYQWQIDGDVPYQIESSRPLPKAERYRIRLIREDDISVVYVNDEIALSYRMYGHSSGKLGFYLVQGNMIIRHLSLKTR